MNVHFDAGDASCSWSYALAGMAPLTVSAAMSASDLIAALESMAR
jgi:hypothetical protein